MALSAYAVAREAASQLSALPQRIEAVAAQYLTWVNAQADPAVAISALAAAAESSKRPEAVLVVAGQVYEAQEGEPGAGGDGGGGGSVDPAAVELIVDQKLESLAVLTALSAGGDPGQVATKASDVDGDVAWANPVLPATENVRVWEAASLVYVQDFIGGLASPFAALAPTVSAVTLNDAALPEYPYGLLLNSATRGTFVRLGLDLNAIPALAGKTPVEISFWCRQTTNGGTPSNMAFKEGATTRLALNGLQAWAKRTFAIASIDADLEWSYQAGSVGSGQCYLTGVAITALNAPYGLNELVRHEEAFYRSLRSNNIVEPGVDSTWELVP